MVSNAEHLLRGTGGLRIGANFSDAIPWEINSKINFEWQITTKMPWLLTRMNKKSLKYKYLKFLTKIHQCNTYKWSNQFKWRKNVYMLLVIQRAQTVYTIDFHAAIASPHGIIDGLLPQRWVFQEVRGKYSIYPQCQSILNVSFSIFKPQQNFYTICNVSFSTISVI
jgi:hypothetical protein